jgi:ribose 5-phosphate isomerase
MSKSEDQLKMAAAESAVALVTDGRSVNQGLCIQGIPTSECTAIPARSLGIPVSSLAVQPDVDITIDGADEVGLTSEVHVAGETGVHILRPNSSIERLQSAEAVWRLKCSCSSVLNPA